MNILTYKGYQGVFEYDQEADIFHGNVINLTDVITFQGRSIDELKQALADSVEDYLDFCADQNKTPDKPYSGRFNLRVDQELHRRMAAEAAMEGKSLNQWIIESLEELVK
ncbi:MAG: type II toxin-antitoxin system HicB family antitoxin [Deferribacteraceae bacterium]|jgi:predicted HicB family RNase H-like nuclease|nr:type II toxin-antitoxin system HicB family antitoxin [Deferribacteraceae bacterium]